MTFSHFHQLRGMVDVELGCPVCGTKLLKGNMIDDQDDVYLSHHECKKCKHCSLALVFQSHVGISSVVSVTDLCFEDVMRMRSGRAVSADDVLGVHEMMKSDEVHKLFEQPRRLA